MYRHGSYDPEIRARRSDLPQFPPGTPVEARFIAQVVRDPGGCWMWTGAVNESGYGVLSGPGLPRPKVYAHRWSYEHHVGPLPADLFVLHSCDVPPCVNPAHLRPGTAADNAADKVARGRSKMPACRQGHPWTEENTIHFTTREGRAGRRCRTCRRASS